MIAPSRTCPAVWVGLAAILTVACADERREAPVVVRVSAVFGLSELVPGPNLTSSAAAAADLVYDMISQHAASLERTGARVRVRLRADEPLGAAEMAPRLRWAGLKEATAVSATEIDVTFVDETAASFFAAGFGGVDIGPFQLVAQDAQGALLRSRADIPIDDIQIVVTSVEDEWRSLLAHDIDVVPSSWEANRRRFAGVRSVRLYDIPVKTEAALFLDASDPALADLAVRRRLAAAIDPAAVATVVCGSPECAPRATRPAAEAVPLPSHLTLMVLATESRDVLTAYVIRHQLRELGVDVEVLPVTIAELNDPHHAQMSISPMSLSDQAWRLRMFLSPGHPDAMPVTGWSNPEFDRAWAAGDYGAAQALVDAAALYVPLYQLRYFAAVDARLCDAHPDSFSSWRWIADLRPCAEGEEP